LDAPLLVVFKPEQLAGRDRQWLELVVACRAALDEASPYVRGAPVARVAEKEKDAPGKAPVSRFCDIASARQVPLSPDSSRTISIRPTHYLFLQPDQQAEITGWPGIMRLPGTTPACRVGLEDTYY